MKFKSLFIVMVIASMLFVVGCHQNNNTENNATENTGAVDISDLPEVVATVNGVDISKADYMATYSTMKSSYDSADIDYATEEGIAFLNALKDTTLNSLIQKEVLTQATAEAGIIITEADVLAEIETIKSQYATIEEFQGVLDQNNLTEEELLPLFQSEMAMDAFLKSQIEPILVSDAEALKEYESYVEQLKASGTTDIPDYDTVKVPFKEQLVKNIEQEQMLEILNHLVEQSDVIINI